MVVTVTTIRRMFQSTHPRRVRRMASPVIWLPPKFQSTHPRRVRLVRLEHRAARVVSIHAPTQGATLGLVGRKLGQDSQSTHPRRVRRREGDLAAGVRLVSIHAPTQGATRNSSANGTTPPCFNPRTHAGCDVCHLYASIVVCCVSIHAPTQGATEIRQSQTARRRSFNPRTHAGCDTPEIVYASANLVFQSTHPRRVRPGRPHAAPRFNPRTHAGCDCLFVTPSYCNKSATFANPIQASSKRHAAVTTYHIGKQNKHLRNREPPQGNAMPLMVRKTP